MFGFVKTSKLFFRSRISRRPSISPVRRPGGNGSERERQRVALLRLEDLLGAARAAHAVGRVRVAQVGRVGDLGVGQLVVVGGGDVREPGRAGRVDEQLHRRRNLLRAGDVELPRRLHEVDLRVDVPEDAACHRAIVAEGAAVRANLRLRRC